MRDNQVRIQRCAAVMALVSVGAGAMATIEQFSDRGVFMAATGAAPLSPWPDVGRISGATYHHEHVHLSISLPSTGLWVGSANHPAVGPDWTTFVDGHDIAIDGRENLNVDFDVPQIAFGFDFAEPTVVTVRYAPCYAGCPCANSNFRVTLRLAGEIVGTFDYNRPDNTNAFVGFLSPVPFDRVEINELDGTCDDEYFGRFYTLDACYADCDLSTGQGTLDIFDFLCFGNKFAANDPYACDCDTSTGPGMCDIFDFLCFGNAFDAGCP